MAWKRGLSISFWCAQHHLSWASRLAALVVAEWEEAEVNSVELEEAVLLCCDCGEEA